MIVSNLHYHTIYSNLSKCALIYSNLYLITGSTSKKKRGPTKCLKTHGLRYEDCFLITLNVFGQPIGRYRATLSSYLGTLERNAHLAPLTYTSWKGLKQNWEDMWKQSLYYTSHLYLKCTFPS